MALGKTVEQLLSEISSAELNEWKAYYILEPFGELMADRRHGIAVSTLANVHRDAKRTPNAYREEDFIYWHETHRQEKKPVLLDPESQSRLIKNLFKVVK